MNKWMREWVSEWTAWEANEQKAIYAELFKVAMIGDIVSISFHVIELIYWVNKLTKTVPGI